MTNERMEQRCLLQMMGTLKKQMECEMFFWNIYAHNAQLMAIATQSLSVELMLLNLLKASGRESVHLHGRWSMCANGRSS